MLRLVVLGRARGHADEEKGKRFEQLLLGQHFAIKKLDGIFTFRLRRIRQASVVPAEVLFTARVGGGHHVACVGSKVKKRVLEDLTRMVAGGELRHRVMHGLVFLVFQLQRHDGQAVEEEDEINLLIGLAEVEVRAKRDSIFAVFRCGGALSRARFGVVEPQLQPSHLQPVAEQHP